MKTPPFAVSPHPNPSRGRRVMLWLVFVGLVALLPSLATLLIGYLSGGTPTVAKLLAEGDGFLVVIAITADAIGRAVDRKKAHLFPTILCGVVLCFALISFVYVKTQTANHRAEIQVATDGAKANADKPAALNSLVDALERKPDSEDNVALFSEFMVIVGLSTSFWVIIL